MTRQPKTIAQWKELAARQQEDIDALRGAFVKVLELTKHDPNHTPSHQLGAIRATAEAALNIEQPY
jgi:hypothetical protein